jgi:NitT/TauT family transport system substrate-binding protein
MRWRRQRMSWHLLRNVLRGVAVLAALAAAVRPAAAQEQIKIGIGFGLAFLPIYICEDLKLIEKQGKALHLDVRPSYQRFLGASPLQEAIGSGEIDVGPFGTAPLLSAWQKQKGTAQQVFAVSGITSMPLTLLSNNPNAATIADIRPADRIAMPSLTAPQMYVLGMQSEKALGRYDRLHDQVVVMSPADAINALIGGGSAVTAYFASPPFAELALRSPGIHSLLSSTEVMNGKASFLVLGATQSFIEARAKLPEIVAKAIDEAARIIRADPRRATQIYLTHEPSRTFDPATIEAVLRENKDEFGSAVYGIQTIADFMARHGELKGAPQSWKDIVAPALLNSPSS